jgi:hypothetical protein
MTEISERPTAVVILRIQDHAFCKRKSLLPITQLWVKDSRKGGEREGENGKKGGQARGPPAVPGRNKGTHSSAVG